LTDLEAKIKDDKDDKDDKAVKENKEVHPNIARLKAQCNAKYADQSYYGAAALNRMIVLDSGIISLLTPDTLIEIFRQNTTISGAPSPDHIITLQRNSSRTTLAGAIRYAFVDGLKTIECLPNNDFNLTHSHYLAQKAAYQRQMPALVSAMVAAAKTLGVKTQPPVEKEETKSTLTDRFNRVVKAVDNTIQAKKAPELLYVPGYSPKNMCEQAVSGFNQAYVKVKLIEDYKETKGDSRENALRSFATQFITHPEIMVDGFVSHMFYDRAHFEACLAQRTEVSIGEHKFQLREVLRAMVTQCEERKNEPAVATAVEQFSLRIALVENDLSQRFRSEYAAAAAPSPAKAVASPTPVTPPPAAVVSPAPAVVVVSPAPAAVAPTAVVASPAAVAPAAVATSPATVVAPAAVATSPATVASTSSTTPSAPSTRIFSADEKAAALGARKADEKTKVDEFIKIYTALREGQTSIFGKSRGLLDKENLTLRDVEEYAKKNPDSRTKIAFDLMQKYHGNVANNMQLVGEIYQYSYNKSTLGSRSRYKKGIFNEGVARSQVNAANSEDNTRTAKIMRSLNKPGR
jgi:hypothetical protein